MRTVDIFERRARLGRRHHLASGASDPVVVSRAMVGLHSSDPTTVFLSTLARMPDLDVATLEEALYGVRSLVRFYGMRRTLWVVDRETVPLVHHSSTRAISIKERKRTIRLLESGGVTTDGDAWLNGLMPKAISEISARGEVLTRELTAAIPELDGKIEIRNRAGDLLGTTGLASRLVLQLAMESKVIRARPAGTWVSGQYRWAETSDWLGGPIPDISVPAAAAELLRRWLYAFGPATETDVAWWTGWTLRQVRTALADIEAVEVELDGVTGFLLADDNEPIEAPENWIALLPSLDPTTMGWKDRDWYLGDHGGVLFDRNGNAGPTVWVDGRVVGGWAQRRDGAVVYELFEDVGSGVTAQIAARARDLADWLGDVVVTPRFRSPHDKNLAS